MQQKANLGLDRDAINEILAIMLEKKKAKNNQYLNVNPFCFEC